ncbi:MAG: hypothetical protein ABIN61_04680 [candidate division WOR-3 bacterium]
MAFEFLSNKKISNIFTFLISLFIATISWYFAKTNEIISIEKKLKLQMKVKQYLIVKNSSVDSVEIKIRAKKRQFDLIRTKKISPILILPFDKPGIFKIKLEERNMTFPSWLGIEDFIVKAPDSIKIEIDSLIEKKVNLTPVREMVFLPQKVTIIGPKSLISNIEYLSPDSIPKGFITTITIENPLIKVYPNKIKKVKK